MMRFLVDYVTQSFFWTILNTEKGSERHLFRGRAAQRTWRGLRRVAVGWYGLSAVFAVVFLLWWSFAT